MKLIDSSVKCYLNQLAGKKPAPGGGSAAALVLSLGLGLFLKCLEFSSSRVGENYSLLKKKLSGLLKQARDLIDKDKSAYTKVARALKLPRRTEEERKRKEKEIDSSLKNAVSVPLQIAGLVREGLLCCKILKSACKKLLFSDLRVGILFLETAFLSAKEFIQENLNWIQDRDFISATKKNLKQLNIQIKKLQAELERR